MGIISTDTGRDKKKLKVFESFLNMISIERERGYQLWERKQMEQGFDAFWKNVVDLGTSYGVSIHLNLI